MNKNPKISIITVCFNSAKTINDTIKSIESQDYNNIEYIWWNMSNGFSYLATILLLFYFLVDEKFKYFQLALIITSYLISYIINRKYIGSIWCWIASFIPLINYLYFTYYLKIKS